MNKAFKAVIATAGLALAAGGLALSGPAAHADTVLFSATTQISSLGANAGSGTDFSTYGIWAYDGQSISGGSDPFTRTLTVSSTNASTCTDNTILGSGFNTSADTCYTASISDSGPFRTVLNAYQPNQGSTQTADRTGDKIIATVAGTFTGGASYVFYTPNTVPVNADYVSATLDAGDNANSGLSPGSQTQNWYQQATATHGGATGVQLNSWTWTYTTSCGESWTDAYGDGNATTGFDSYGQSTPLSTFGEITGSTSNCTSSNPTPPPITITGPSGVGDYVNGYSNGFDVRGQGAWANNQIIGWTAYAGDTDPAVHFITNPESGGFSLEYAPDGSGDGLCVSNPGDNLLVLRNCNGSIWQRFYTSGGYVRSAVNNGYVNPDGKGAQLSVGGGPSSWGGSKYAWVNNA